MSRNSPGPNDRIDVIELLRCLAADRISLIKRLNEKVAKGKLLTQADDDSQWQHAFFLATALVAKRIGHPEQEVQEFAERVGTPLGLNYLKGRDASWSSDGSPERRDLNHLSPLIHDLDVDEVLAELELCHPNAVVEIRKRSITHASEAAEILLDDFDVAVLQYLNESPSVAKSQEDIAAGAKIGRKAVGERLKQLREVGYVARPEGKKSKDAITPKGIERLAKVTQN